MPTPTLAARIGRFQTRLTRTVDILASRPVIEPIPGKPGQTMERTIWTGLLYKSDGKTVDTLYEWEASGAFRNQRGVANPNDLALFMRELSPEELEAGLALLPESAKPAPASAAAAPEEAKPEAPQAEGQRAINLRQKRQARRRAQQVNAG